MSAMRTDSVDYVAPGIGTRVRHRGIAKGGSLRGGFGGSLLSLRLIHGFSFT